MVKEWLAYYPAMMDNTTSSGMPNLVNESAPGVGDGDVSRVSQIHAVRDAALALEAEVGSGATESGTVRWRLLTLETTPVDAVKIQARPVLSTAPTASGQALVWDSAAAAWRPGAIEEGNAVKIQARPVSAGAPSNGQVLTWIAANARWEPSTASGGGPGSSSIYNEEVWHLLGTETPGSTQTHGLSVQPVVSSNSVPGYAVEMYREGLKMEPVTTVSGYMGFKYNNSLLRVEFKAPGSNDLYQLVYWSAS